jgi:hypothetical protein
VLDEVPLEVVLDDECPFVTPFVTVMIPKIALVPVLWVVVFLYALVLL